jgi:transcriptional regulator with XRE-family HTH domain
MALISSIQSQLARTLLSWTQQKLADRTKVCVQTIRNFEKGQKILPSTIEEICFAFETVGIEFLEGDGVRRREKWCVPSRSDDNCDSLFNDISETIKERGGTVLVYISDCEAMMHRNGNPRRNNLERFNALCKSVEVRCIMKDSAMRSDFVPLFPYKTLHSSFAPIRGSLIVYANKYADLLWDASGQMYVVALDVNTAAQFYRNGLNDLWQKAVTIEQANKLSKRHVETAHIALY